MMTIKAAKNDPTGEAENLARVWECLAAGPPADIIVAYRPESTSAEVQAAWAEMIRSTLTPGGLVMLFGMPTPEARKALLDLFGGRFLKHSWTVSDGEHGLGGFGVAFALSDPERFFGVRLDSLGGEVDEQLVKRYLPDYPREFIDEAIGLLATHHYCARFRVTNLLNTEGRYAVVHRNRDDDYSVRSVKEYRAFVTSPTRRSREELHTRRVGDPRALRMAQPAPAADVGELQASRTAMRAARLSNRADVLLVRYPRHGRDARKNWEATVRDGLARGGVACVFGFPSVEEREQALLTYLDDFDVLDRWSFDGEDELAGAAAALSRREDPCEVFWAPQHDYDQTSPLSVAAEIIHDAVYLKKPLRIVNVLRVSDNADLERVDLGLGWTYDDDLRMADLRLTSEQRALVSAAMRGTLSRQHGHPADRHLERLLDDGDDEDVSSSPHRAALRAQGPTH